MPNVHPGGELPRYKKVLNDKGISRTPFNWNMKETTGSRNGYVFASRAPFNNCGMCGAARKWNAAAAPRRQAPTLSDLASGCDA
jgi:hypothetical protein